MFLCSIYVDKHTFYIAGDYEYLLGIFVMTYNAPLINLWMALIDSFILC